MKQDNADVHFSGYATIRWDQIEIETTPVAQRTASDYMSADICATYAGNWPACRCGQHVITKSFISAAAKHYDSSLTAGRH